MSSILLSEFKNIDAPRHVPSRRRPSTQGHKVFQDFPLPYPDATRKYRLTDTETCGVHLGHLPYVTPANDEREKKELTKCVAQ